MNYIGIDIGDGESCVCILPAVSNIEPRALNITGKKSFLSAIACDSNGNFVIGSDAASLGAAKGFSVRFKSRFLADTENARQEMKTFLTCIHDILKNENHFEEDNSITVGCPAGWNDKARSDYLEIIKEAGFENVRLVSESRAAFLYAKYTQSIQMDPTLIEDSALVIDIGSSTLDFAYVVDGKETNVGTFGDVYLGGGAIDEALLASAVNSSAHKNELLKIFADAPEWRNYCLLCARRVKEDYFTRQSNGEMNIHSRDMVNIMYDRMIPLEIRADDILIWREVNAPIKALNGDSFYKILQKALVFAKAKTSENPPKLVLLTGGASRMKFFRDMCREQFAGSQFIICDEPDLSIAKGLAYSGRLDEKILLFNQEISDYLKNTNIHNAVASQMDGLVESLAKTMADIAYVQAKTSYEKWQQGDYETMNDMGSAMALNVKNSLQSEAGKQAIANEISDEINNIGAILQQEIDQICKKYGIDEKQMKLPIFEETPLSRSSLPEVPLDMNFFMNTVMIAVGAAVFIIMGIIPGTQVLDFIITVVSVIAVRLGFNPIGGTIKNINFPKLIRKQIPIDNVINTKFYGNIYSAFLEALRKNVDFHAQIADSIEQGLRDYVNKLAKKTEIAITSGENLNGTH